ncbi:putative cGMP-dependent kinase, protein kinase-like domain superfamily [Plasmopara halstedii]
MAPLSVRASVEAANKACKGPKAAVDEKWANVKTWTFAQLLASSLAKVSLEDVIQNDCNSQTDGMTRTNGKSKTTCGNNDDWKCSYNSLNAPLTTSEAATKKNGNNDWDCSYNLKPHATRSTFSASSSSSTLLSDAEGSHSRHSLDDVLEHEETVIKDRESEMRHVFDIVRIIGSGSYGTVLLCRLRACFNRLYAVKVVYKAKLSTIDGDTNAARQVQRLLTERKILSTVDHPFITKMYCSFETPDALNFVLEYCPGGDMYFLLEKYAQHRLPEAHVQFYAASIALALHYLHERGILYRDLKPENILLDEAGFLRLADFGLAREHMKRTEQICTSFCGSADYIAPEMIRGDGYGLAADLWSYGCVVYELLTGYPPFYLQHDRALLFHAIETDELSFPKHFSPTLCAFLSGLLHKEAHQRLGNGPNGMQEIFDHPFFANVSWHRLETKQVAPPIVPKLTSKLDTSNFEDQFTSQLVEGHLVYEERDSQSALTDEVDNSFFFGEFDWCADATQFKEYASNIRT